MRICIHRVGRRSKGVGHTLNLMDGDPYPLATIMTMFYLQLASEEMELQFVVRVPI
jgi:hypothetical protein